MYRAFVHNDSGDTGWSGLRSSVRARFEGPNALRWEVAWFVGRMYVMPFVQQVLAAICLISSLGTNCQKYLNEGRYIYIYIYIYRSSVSSVSRVSRVG